MSFLLVGPLVYKFCCGRGIYLLTESILVVQPCCYCCSRTVDHNSNIVEWSHEKRQQNLHRAQCGMASQLAETIFSGDEGTQGVSISHGHIIKGWVVRTRLLYSIPLASCKGRPLRKFA